MEQKQKPNLTFWQLWNLSFAYLGIQIGYSLQGTQMSGIFSALGAPDQDLAILWLGGPLAGILVQPIIGLFSDKTWIKGLGRRIPFLLVGGILATLMMVLIVNTKVLAGNMKVLAVGSAATDERADLAAADMSMITVDQMINL